MDRPRASHKYRHMNHHHELTNRHQMVNIGGKEFIANVDAIPLLTALSDAGIETRSHHHVLGERHSFIVMMMDNIEIEVRRSFENASGRTEYNGRMEVVLTWRKALADDASAKEAGHV